MAARNHQGDERKVGGLRAQEYRRYMAFQMVYADKGPVSCVGKGFRDLEPHQKRTHESRPAGHGYPLYVPQHDSGIVQGLHDDWYDCFHVLTGSDLRNDSAV